MYFRQLLILSLVGLAFAAPSSKVEPRLAKALSTKSTVNIFVKFEGGNKAALNTVSNTRFNTRTDKINHMVSSMKALATSSQKNAVAMLRSPRFSYSATTFKQFWVSNELFVKNASPELVAQLATLPEVSEVRQERVITLEEVTVSQADQWNLDKVEAPNAWNLPGGNNGQGVVVANIDTGVRHTHEALRGNYRADYGWFDPYNDSNEPSDENGHGTHTMGTIAGTGVGVAPGAQWVACQGCYFIFCTEEALKACGQWTICPTLPDGTQEDCSKAPKVVSNSWGGQGNDDFYNDVIAAWQEANIIPVFALGNSGSTCSSAGSPGDQEGVIGVSSTTTTDSLAGSSSRGPAFDGRLKPDLSAPGQEIRSAWYTGDDQYSVISGTSMACPHVAGATALLLSRNPNLTYQQIKTLLEDNAEKDMPDMNQTCGGIPSNQLPSNHYGHGRLNARRSLEAAINSF